ncbi:MAG: biotin/lipoyl-containing protein [Chloroflexota bacterium]
MTMRLVRGAVVTLDESEFEVSVSTDGEQLFVTCLGESTPVAVRALGPHHWMVRLEQRWVEVFGFVRGGEGRIVVGGRQFAVSVVDERARQFAALTQAAGGGSAKVEIRAPMPGLIVSIPLEVGQVVKRGERLVVLQAMKMENELTSPRDGRVAAVHVEEAQTVEQGFVLVTLEGEQP